MRSWDGCGGDGEGEGERDEERGELHFDGDGAGCFFNSVVMVVVRVKRERASILLVGERPALRLNDDL